MAIFLDIEKAFDSVRSDIITNKLVNYGFSGSILQWIRCFLNNRTFQVKINNTLSNVKPVKIGLPQGSVISPIIFKIYINDLIEYCNNCKISIFADDIAIWYSSKHLGLAEKKVQEDLHSISSWVQINHLKLSATKSKAMIFTRCRKAKSVKLYITDTIVEVTPEYKFLGVILDSKYIWKAHIDTVILKCKKRLNIIRCKLGSGYKNSPDKL